MFSSTTRSPISTGCTIQSAIAFSDNYGLGIPNYVYNVAHRQFDRILILLRNASFRLDPGCRGALCAYTMWVITYE
ncbi:TRSP domain-containing protein [Klebsiella pneumoniae]|uniref:TRSP domain-containing protein n=1 Tax=Klebsiella pneumoniae TaxID=573 RepID=UPI0024BEE92E|nr:TRSP domain-containing protein [Klebsiella pneumoniae]